MLKPNRVLSSFEVNILENKSGKISEKKLWKLQLSTVLRIISLRSS